MSVADFEDEEFVSTQQLALRIQIAAAGITSSLILIGLPNIETITLTAFFVGFLFPKRFALSITLTMTFGWELLISSLLGFSGPVLIFKVLAWSIITLLGSVARSFNIKRAYEFAIFGIISALLFDFLVTLAIPIFFVNSGSQGFVPIFLTVLIAGLPFTFLHILGNTIMFSFIPGLLETSYAPLERGYRNILQIERSYFDTNSRHLFALSLIAVLIIAPIGGYYAFDVWQTNQDKGDDIIEVTFTFDYSSVLPDEMIIVNVTVSDTVFEIMLLIIDFEFTRYGGAPLIDSINGVENNNQLVNYYWKYYINGEYATKDVDSVTLNANDIVVWNYER